MQTLPFTSADAFVDFLGFNVHMFYLDTQCADRNSMLGHVENLEHVVFGTT